MRDAGAVFARGGAHGARPGAGGTRRRRAPARVGPSLSLLRRPAPRRRGGGGRARPRGDLELVAASPDGKETARRGCAPTSSSTAGTRCCDAPRAAATATSRRATRCSSTPGRSRRGRDAARSASRRARRQLPRRAHRSRHPGFGARSSSTPRAGARRPGRSRTRRASSWTWTEVKASTRPGETAVVQVRAPFPGKLLVTVERDRVAGHADHDLTGNTATIEVPIRGRVPAERVHHGHARAGGGRTSSRAAGRAFGAVPLPVDRGGEQAEAAIRRPAEMRPDREAGGRGPHRAGCRRHRRRGGRGHPSAHRPEDARAVRATSTGGWRCR